MSEVMLMSSASRVRQSSRNSTRQILASLREEQQEREANSQQLADIKRLQETVSASSRSASEKTLLIADLERRAEKVRLAIPDDGQVFANAYCPVRDVACQQVGVGYGPITADYPGSVRTSHEIASTRDGSCFIPRSTAENTRNLRPGRPLENIAGQN